MATGFYTAASGMLMQQRILNVLGNNMSNDQTPGFKTARTISSTFEWELLNRVENHRDHLLNAKASPVRIVHDVPTDIESGSFMETQRPYDMAVNSEGFFNVIENGETYMTRNGNFDIDPEGYLILRGHGRVQGEDGDIHVGGSNFTVDVDGSIHTVDSRGKRVDIDKLLITAPDEGILLTVKRNGMYQLDGDPKQTPVAMGPNGPLDAQAQPVQPPVPGAAAEGEDAPEPNDDERIPIGAHVVENPNIRQFSLETSNVELNREMALMMETQRNFQSCSRALSVIDEIDSRTVMIAQQ